MSTPDPLTDAVRYHAARGARVESHTPTMATVVYGRRPNHILHLLLTIFTFGLWLLVWLIVDTVQRERRIVLTVDPSGGLHEDTHTSPNLLFGSLWTRRSRDIPQQPDPERQRLDAWRQARLEARRRGGNMRRWKHNNPRPPRGATDTGR